MSLGEDLRRSCLDLEVDAVATEAYVWSTFWAGDPPSRTELEAALTETSRIAAAEGEVGLRRYVGEDGRYDGECGAWLTTGSVGRIEPPRRRGARA